ncbi:MAG: 16S rRNA (adenine(1518)-N(6)/adenine(1519)-N(6))-dimethyltransferase RsmA [Leptospiraceae bacterium]|nr:16S rRNA (adenine(1518)-N(6)/adenine(1519)-N(6))-dimethyltransferase RsmA [Leptospiraceae bacterium]
MIEYPFYSKSKIKDFLEIREAGIRKKWGQNFLTDPNTTQFIADSIPEDAILNSEYFCEIGPGLGALTHRLGFLKQKLVLLEIDPILVENLKIAKYLNDNIEIIQGDAVSTMLSLPDTSCYFLGNLPYYITSELITSVLMNFSKINGAIFMVQKEFADRIVNETSSFSIFTKAFGNWKYLRKVNPTCFFPSPNAISSLIQFQPYEEKRFNKSEIKYLELILRSFFWGKRKTLHKIISESPFLEIEHRDILANLITEKEKGQRPEDIIVSRYYELAKNLSNQISS